MALLLLLRTCVLAPFFSAWMLTPPLNAQGTGCLTPLAETVRCGPEAGWTYTFRLRNDSRYTVNAVSVTGAGESARTIDLAAPLAPGDSTAAPLTIDLTGDSTRCLELVLRQLHPSLRQSLNCCYATRCIDPPRRPLARVADPEIARCEDDPLQLDASGSEPATVRFQWTTDGPTGSILSGENTSRPFVQGPGGYAVVVADPDNGCTDSTRVTVSGGDSLLLRDDSLEVTGLSPVLVDVLENDRVPPGSRPLLLTPPEVGEARITPDGRLEYLPPPCFAGEVRLTYAVTDPDCPERDGSASVLLTGFGYELYNVITPDGDGRNETFVFDLLEFCPGEYPDNRMEIFNRWGDVVYRAAPYRNEWAGTNQRGGPLPEATYYYILRLDLGEGLILRGDVTVLR